MDSPATASLLLVDDDAELCALLTEYLGARGFDVTCAYDGLEGLRRALEPAHDLVVLDVMLPKLGGFEVLRQLRRQSQVPVLMLTARVAEQDRIGGLETGADDYLVKPFVAGELVARIRALLRRARREPTRTGSIAIGPLSVNPDTRDVTWDGRPVPLTSLEFSLLELLMQSAGRAVSRDELSAALFQREPGPYDRALDVHVSNLRRKLEAAGGLRAREGLIRTVRGVGYQFVMAE